MTNVESAAMGISNAGKPTILASKVMSSNPTLVKMTVEGNTGLDYSLDTGTGVGKEMGLTKNSEGLQRIGHTSPGYSSIFYTEESGNGYSTTLVRSSIDVLYPYKRMWTQVTKHAWFMSMMTITWLDYRHWMALGARPRF